MVTAEAAQGRDVYVPPRAAAGIVGVGSAHWKPAAGKMRVALLENGALGRGAAMLLQSRARHCWRNTQLNWGDMQRACGRCKRVMTDG